MIPLVLRGNSIHRSSREIASGLIWATIAVLIWSASLVMLRLGVTTTLNAYDLTALRFGVAAVLLAPVMCSHRYKPVKLGMLSRFSLIIGFGAPYILLVSVGLNYAPASAAGALNPGLMAVFVALVGSRMFNDRLGTKRLAGIALIFTGVVLFADINAFGDVSRGHMFFSLSAAMWAAYVLVVRHAKVPALQATVIVAIGSAILYLPIYIIAIPKNIFIAPINDVLYQAIFHGVLVSIIAVFAFNRSSEHLGPVTGSTLPALVPITTLGLGVLILEETATPYELLATIMIGIGVSLTLKRSARD